MLRLAVDPHPIAVKAENHAACLNQLQWADKQLQGAVLPPGGLAYHGQLHRTELDGALAVLSVHPGEQGVVRAVLLLPGEFHALRRKVQGEIIDPAGLFCHEQQVDRSHHTGKSAALQADCAPVNRLLYLGAARSRIHGRQFKGVNRQLQFFALLRGLLQRSVEKSGGEVAPEYLQRFGLLGLAAVDDNAGVVVPQCNCKLGVQAVRPEGVGDVTLPELVAVTHAVVRGAGCIVNLAGGRRIQPLFGDDLPPLPHTAVQAALDKFGLILRADLQAPAPCLSTGWIGLPKGDGDPQRLKQAGCQVFGHRLPRDLVNNGAEQIGICTCVQESSARLKEKVPPQEVPHPVRVLFQEQEGIVHLSGGHHQQMAHGEGFGRTALLPNMGKQIADLCIQCEEALLNGKPDRHACKALAVGKHGVRHAGLKRLAPYLRSHFTVAQDHEGVNFTPALFAVPDPVDDSLRTHADLLRRLCAGQGGDGMYVFHSRSSFRL